MNIFVSLYYTLWTSNHHPSLQSSCQSKGKDSLSLNFLLMKKLKCCSDTWAWIWELPDSNLGQDIGGLSLTNTGVVSLIRPWPLPSPSIPIYYSLLSSFSELHILSSWQHYEVKYMYRTKWNTPHEDPFWFPVILISCEVWWSLVLDGSHLSEIQVEEHIKVPE
jgi:hypothetical protein